MTAHSFTDLGLTAKDDAGCACCGPEGHADMGALSGAESSTEAAVQTTFPVEGMTCAHCVSSVTEEVSELDGVVGVDVELHAGGVSLVTVSSAAPLDPERVREAVEEAGYRFAPAS